MWTPFFNPTIVPEETTGPIGLKFGMEVPYDILFWLIGAFFEIPPQTRFMGVVGRGRGGGKMRKNFFQIFQIFLFRLGRYGSLAVRKCIFNLGNRKCWWKISKIYTRVVVRMKSLNFKKVFLSRPSSFFFVTKSFKILSKQFNCFQFHFFVNHLST